MSVSDSEKVVSGKAGLVMIRCFCGFEILLVPDVTVMSKAMAHMLRNIRRKLKISKLLKQKLNE
jgi:hypothetical protein